MSYELVDLVGFAGREFFMYLCIGLLVGGAYVFFGSIFSNEKRNGAQVSVRKQPVPKRVVPTPGGRPIYVNQMNVFMVFAPAKQGGQPVIDINAAVSPDPDEIQMPACTNLSLRSPERN